MARSSRWLAVVLTLISARSLWNFTPSTAHADTSNDHGKRERTDDTGERNTGNARPQRADGSRAKERARSSSVDLRRGLAGHELGRGAVRNHAPAGATELDRALQRALDSILTGSVLKTAINGVYVVDAATGRVLYAYGEDRQIDPASNAKLISTATAFDALGSNYSYRTGLRGPTPDAQGVVHGDVYLVGSADPLLGVDDLMDLANGLRDAGIRRIDGDLIVGSDEERDGLAHAELEVTVRGAEVDGRAPEVSVHPASPLFVLENNARTSSARRVRPEVSVETVKKNGTLRVRVTVSGRVHPDQVFTATRNVPHPLLFAAHTVRAYAELAGVEITGNARQSDNRRPEPAGVVDLAVHRSVPLSRLAQLINKPSDNFLADRLIATVGGEVFGGDPSMSKGVKAMASWLGRIGIAVGSYRLENGSGLSHTIHVTARQIAQVLLAGAADPRFGTAWVDSFAIGGQDGTLASRFANRASAGWIRGKTGTLDGVAALSGFVAAPGGDSRVCFAILSQGFREGRKRQIRAAQSDAVDAIFRYLAARNEGGSDLTPEATPPAPDFGRDDED
jgi:serine-type D-Ala-D-Ala carboxypeptidase/endopeptidase (penicillin-binding protein 4)